MTDKEFHDNLTRYYHLVNILDKLLLTVRTAFKGNPNWFLFSEKLGRKLLTHCKSLCLNSAETFIFDDGTNNRSSEYMDIPGIFINLRAQSDAYATLHHLFFDNRSMDLKRLRFDLWRIDSLVEWVKQTNRADLLAEGQRIPDIVAIILSNNEYQKFLANQQKLIFVPNQDEKKIYANWKFIPEKLTSKRESKVGWKDIFLNAGLSNAIFEQV